MDEVTKRVFVFKCVDCADGKGCRTCGFRGVLFLDAPETEHPPKPRETRVTTFLERWSRWVAQ